MRENQNQENRGQHQFLFEDWLKSLNAYLGNSKIKNHVGFRIKKIRELLNISQSKLASLIGKSRSLIEKYESDDPPKKGINITILKKIAVALSSPLFLVTVEHLKGEDSLGQF